MASVIKKPNIVCILNETIIIYYRDKTWDLQARDPGRHALDFTLPYLWTKFWKLGHSVGRDERTQHFYLVPIVWQYGLWSFQTGGTKLERFLPKNQHTQRK